MLKNIMLIVAGMLLGVIVLGVAGYAFAQTQTPPTPWGPGMKSGRGGGMMGGTGQGVLHDYMLKAWAEAFEMSPEELQARLNQGDTMSTIAQEKGLSQEAFFQMMAGVRTKAIQAAVADGVITQQQAEWMLSHMNRMGSGGFGARGGGNRGFGGRGGGPCWGTPQATEPAG